jgi:hypothetical protein
VKTDDSNVSVDEENKMTVAEAISCCGNLINFVERKSFTAEQEIMQMYRLGEKFEKERRSKSKQTTLTSFQKSCCIIKSFAVCRFCYTKS